MAGHSLQLAINSLKDLVNENYDAIFVASAHRAAKT